MRMALRRPAEEIQPLIDGFATFAAPSEASWYSYDKIVARWDRYREDQE
jgi:hypothetical protein